MTADNDGHLTVREVRTLICEPYGREYAQRFPHLLPILQQLERALCGDTTGFDGAVAVGHEGDEDDITAVPPPVPLPDEGTRISWRHFLAFANALPFVFEALFAAQRQVWLCVAV